jgi:hypothetical protein
VRYLRFKNKALLKTLTELKAIAAPPTTGFKYLSTASVMPAACLAITVPPPPVLAY